MSRQVVTRLEALSGYQFHFNFSDPKAALNPVNYAHTQVRIGAETLSVLSRIAFSGADYSGRTNKIAHHVLLEHGEQLPNGPAWMLMEMAREVFVAGYSGEPRNLPKRDLRTLLPTEPRPPEPATTWQSQTGDAGWAGMLVNAFRENPKVPAFVIFSPGQELLPLFEESLALLPPEERWQVAFATYYTALPAGCQYHWRGIIAGSPATKEIQRFPNATVLDLTTALGRAPDNTFTQAARTGTVLPPVRAPERPKIQIVERAVQPVPVAAEVADEADALALAMEPEQHGPRVDLRDVAPSPSQLRSLIQRARRARWVPLLFAAVILLAVSTLISTTLHFYNPWHSTPQAETATAAATPVPPAQGVSSTPGTPSLKPPCEGVSATSAAPGANAPTPVSSPEQGGKAADTKQQIAQTNKPEIRPDAAKPPKDRTGAESGAKPSTEPDARGQPLPKAAPPSTQELGKTTLPSGAPPDQPGGPPDPTVQKSTSDIRIDTVGRNIVLLEKKYQVQWLDPPKADKDGNLRWKVAAASSFVDMPPGLEPTKAVCETSGRLEITMPSESAARVLMMSCLLDTGGREHELICTVSKQASTHFAAEYRNSVVELADHKSRQVLRCPFEKINPAVGSVHLGYSANGKAISEDTYILPYPWAAALRISEPPRQDMIVTIQPDTANKRVVLRVQVNNLPNMVEIMQPNWDTRAKAQKAHDEAQRKYEGKKKDVEVREKRLKNMPAHGAEEKLNKIRANADVEQRKRELPALEEEVKKLSGMLEQTRAPAESAAALASAKMEETGKAIGDAGVLRVFDPWDRAVAEVQVKFASCKPENVTGP
jgi:hypothetical protein